MRCPNEFILSQYADGELSKSETMELEPHLNTCRACGEKVAALRTEAQLLVECLQGADMCESAPETVLQKRTEFSGIDRLAVASLAMVILLRIGLGFFESSELPSVLQWLHPWSLSGLLNWLMNGLFYIIEEGEGVMTFLAEVTGFAVLGFLLLGCCFAVTRRAIRAKAILGLVSLMFVFAIPGYAIDIRRAEKGVGGDVSVAPNETINDTLVAFADSVTISGTVTGDLIAFARDIDIQGTVQGNVIGFAQRIDVSGNVGGDIFAFGQSIRADGQIGQSMWGFGQSLTLGKGIRLNGDATLFGSNAYLNGDVGRDATIFAGTVDVRNRVARNLHFSGGQALIHAPSAIGGNLKLMTESPRNLKIDPGVTIAGKKIVEFLKAKPSKYRTMGFYKKQAFRIGAGFLMGLMMYWLIPGMRRITFTTAKGILTSGGIGFLAAIAAPVAAIILAITLIGIPVSVLIILLWLLGLYLSKIIVARWIGSAILGTRENGLSSILLPLLVGIVLIVVAVNLPYIGGILNFLMMLIGLGALVMAVYRLRPVATPQD